MTSRTPPPTVDDLSRDAVELLPPHIQRSIKIDLNRCWLWIRSTSRDGYGWASLANKTYQAHRLVYRLLVGEPTAGTVLDHLCRVRNCVNPAHLQPVTNRVNLQRGNTTTGAMHCAEGHLLEWNGRQRRCPTCQRNWKRQYMREYRRGLRRRAA